jgi:hypothetical protein
MQTQQRYASSRRKSAPAACAPAPGNACPSSACAPCSRQGKGRAAVSVNHPNMHAVQCMPSHPCIHPPTPPFACAPGCIACKVLEKERALVLVDIHGHPGQPAASDRGLRGSSSESPPLRHGQMAIPPCMQQSKKWRRIRQFPTCCPAGLSAVHPCPPGRRGRR